MALRALRRAGAPRRRRLSALTTRAGLGYLPIHARPPALPPRRPCGARPRRLLPHRGAARRRDDLRRAPSSSAAPTGTGTAAPRPRLPGERQQRAHLPPREGHRETSSHLQGEVRHHQGRLRDRGINRAFAPNGADRFYNLVKLGFYDGARFYRAVDGFMVQFGVSGDPSVNGAWYRASIPDDPVVKSNTRGFVTFAMAGANSPGTQSVHQLRRQEQPARRHGLRALRPGGAGDGDRRLPLQGIRRDRAQG